MDEQQHTRKLKLKRKRCICIFAVLVAIIVIGGLVVGLTRSKHSESEHEKLRNTFLSRCEEKKGHDCPKIWSAFEQAFIGKDPCTVPPEAYDALLDAAPFEPACNRMLFWSKTKDVVHDLTERRSCHLTLEDTLLGSVLDELKWCSKEGSNDSFTTDCPAWSDCDNNPVRSFWNKASASFAEVACGDVSVMLNGSIATPFSPVSIFGSIEVKHFNPAVMKSLSVILVTQTKEVSNCTNVSLKDLQKALAQGIAYSCQEVTESRIEECASNPEIPCGGCWWQKRPKKWTWSFETSPWNMQLNALD